MSNRPISTNTTSAANTQPRPSTDTARASRIGPSLLGLIAVLALIATACGNDQAIETEAEIDSSPGASVDPAASRAAEYDQVLREYELATERALERTDRCILAAGWDRSGPYPTPVEGADLDLPEPGPEDDPSEHYSEAYLPVEIACHEEVWQSAELVELEARLLRLEQWIDLDRDPGGLIAPDFVPGCAEVYLGDTELAGDRSGFECFFQQYEAGIPTSLVVAVLEAGSGRATETRIYLADGRRVAVITDVVLVRDVIGGDAEMVRYEGTDDPGVRWCDAIAPGDAFPEPMGCTAVDR